MKKILLISNMYPSKKYKHYGVFVQNTAKILSENGYQVKVVALKKKDNKLTKLLGYTAFYLQAIVYSLFNNYDYLYAHYVSHCALLIKIIKKIKPKIKVIINVHGNDVVPEDKHDEKYVPLVKSIMPLIDYCIVPSQYFKNIMINDYHLTSNKVSIFPSGGINFKVFKQLNSRLTSGLVNKKITVGYVGRYETRKGWEIFIEALHQLNDINQYQVIMVGTGDQEEQADQLIKEYNLDKYIKKYKMLNQKELAQIYNNIDIFCFPTYRRSESLGLVGLEAMACGAIVVASNMAGPTSYVKDRINGFFFEPQNSIDLKDKIEMISSLDNDDIIKIKKEAYKTAKQYDVEKITNILIEIFARV